MGPVREVSAEARANAMASAGNVSGTVGTAQRHVHHLRLAALERRGKRFRGDGLHPYFFQAEHRCGGHPLLQRVTFDAALQHHRVAPAHLHEPGGGHRRAHAIVIDQHDARAQRAGLLVGSLHELAARDPSRVGQVSGLVLLAVADVEHEERTFTGLGAPSVEGGAVDRPHAEPLRHPRRRGTGLLQSGRGRFPDMPGRSLGELQTGEMPRHGAVAQARHPVGNPGIDDRLRADDAPGPARAVHDDGGVRRRHRVVHAVRELRAGAAHAAGDAEVGEFGRRAAVQDDEVLARREHRVELRGRDRRCAELVLDHFPVRLARDVDAADEGVAGRGPGVDAAIEHRDIGVAELPEPGCGPLGFAGPGVAHDDPGRAARNQLRGQQLEPRERAAARAEEVRVVERADLAGVEQRELVIVEDHASQLLCGNCLHVLPPLSFTSSTGNTIPLPVTGVHTVRENEAKVTDTRRLRCRETLRRAMSLG